MANSAQYEATRGHAELGVRTRLSRLFANPAVAKLLKTSTLLVGARFVGAGLAFGTQVALARLLGAEALGMFYLALSFAGVLAIVGGLGYPAITARFVAEYRTQDKMQALRVFVTTTRRDTSLVCLVFLVLFVATLLLWLQGSWELKLCLFIGALTAPILAFVRLNGALANAYRRFALSYLPDLLGRPALFLGTMGVLVAAQISVTVPQLLGLHLVIVLLVTVWQAVRVHSASPWDEADGRREPASAETSEPTGTLWRRHALPMVVVALFTALFADFAMLVLGPLLPPQDIAIFGVSIKVALLMGFGIQVIHQVSLPDAADFHAQGDLEAVRKIVRRANILNTATCLAATLALVLLGEMILGVFGEQFTRGRTCLVILGLSQVLRAAAGPSSQMLTLVGRERDCIPVFATCLVVMAVLSAALASTFGLEGAAVAVLVVTALWTFWLSLIASRKSGVPTALFGTRAAALRAA